VPDEDLEALYDHLSATGELPVETSASRYLGEAEAVVEDALEPDTPDAVVRSRVQQAQELLSHVDETGDDRADRHVADARDLCDTLLETL
jgi:hypothetical protein